MIIVSVNCHPMFLFPGDERIERQGKPKTSEPDIIKKVKCQKLMIYHLHQLFFFYMSLLHLLFGLSTSSYKRCYRMIFDQSQKVHGLCCVLTKNFASDLEKSLLCSRNRWVDNTRWNGLPEKQGNGITLESLMCWFSY